jgi:hypothetical protein
VSPRSFGSILKLRNIKNLQFNPTRNLKLSCPKWSFNDDACLTMCDQAILNGQCLFLLHCFSGGPD